MSDPLVVNATRNPIQLFIHSLHARDAELAELLWPTVRAAIVGGAPAAVVDRIADDLLTCRG